MTVSIRSTNDIKAEMTARFGFFPPFFEPALSQPAVLENLWTQTVSSYIDNPIPALFKEKLAAILARDCTVPYCLIVHTCSLRPLGLKSSQVLEMLSKSNSTISDTKSIREALQDFQPISEWPADDSKLSNLIFDASIIIFSRINTSELQNKLRHILGEKFFSHLNLFLSYNRMCHKWAEAHPELNFEADLRAMENLTPLLDEKPELASFFQNYQVMLRQRLVDREGELLSKEFRILFEKSPMPIVITDLELCIIRFNSAFSALTGYSKEELLRRNIEQLEIPEFSTSEHEQLSPLKDGSISAVVVEKAYAHKNGKKILVTCTFSAIKVGVHPVYLIALVKDITLEREVFERERLRTLELEQRVLERTRELEIALADSVEANVMKNEFLQTISHEFRTPMNGILGMTEVLAMDLEGEKLETAAHILHATHDLMKLVNDLLDMSRLDANDFQIFSESFNLRSLLDSVGRVHSQRAEFKGLKFEKSFDDNIPIALMGDKARIKQVLDILLSNAVKFTDTGKISFRVDVIRKSDSSAAVQFLVEDTGIGITESDRTKLFQLFVQLDASTTRRHGGTGLGLTICERLVALMKGKISVMSEPGVGSTFGISLTLPIPANP